MPRALVIGATGFVGLNVVDALLAAGWDVAATVRPRSPTLLLRKRPAALLTASLEDPGALRAAVAGRDAVFLAGAHYPRYSIDREASLAEGVAGVRNACAAALDAGVGRVVYTSSVATLGPAPAGRAADERDVPAAMPEGSVYRAVKWAMEREVERWSARGLDVVTLRPGGCLGAGDLRVGTSAFLVGVVRRVLPWWVEGTVNLVDVEDVARAHVAAARAPGGASYNLAGHTVRVGWLLARVAARYGGAVPATRLAPDEARAAADADERRAAPRRERVPLAREMVDLITTGQPVSDARAARELGATFAPLDDALDRAHAWLVRLGAIPRTPIDNAEERR